MRTLTLILFLSGLLLAAPIAEAQGPGGPGGPGGFGGFGGGLSKSADIDDLVSRMMAFDENKDGKLTKSEVTDQRLVGLFDRADADKDGTVTKAELTALAEKEYVSGGGPGGPGGPGFGGPGGPGFGGPGGPPSRPGEVLSAMVQQRLGLSTEQKDQITALQAEVDAKLAKILNEEQKSQLKQMRERGPGGPGGGPRRGGPGGGGPGGGPPGGGPGGPGGGPPPPGGPRG
jgi:EF hand